MRNIAENTHEKSRCRRDYPAFVFQFYPKEDIDNVNTRAFKTSYFNL